MDVGLVAGPDFLVPSGVAVVRDVGLGVGDVAVVEHLDIVVVEVLHAGLVGGFDAHDDVGADAEPSLKARMSSVTFRWSLIALTTRYSLASGPLIQVFRVPLAAACASSAAASTVNLVTVPSAFLRARLISTS